MKGHLYRIFILCKSQIIFLACLQAVLSVFIIVFSPIYLNVPSNDPSYLQIICAGVEAGMLLFGMSMFTTDYFRIDEKLTTACFLCSTPKSVKAQVAAKYFFILIVGLCILSADFVVDYVLMLITRGAVSCMMVNFLMFCFLLLTNAIEMPFFFRFGAAKGAVIKGAVFGSVMILLVIYGLFGDISFFLGDDPLGAFIEFMSGDGPMWAMALTPYVCVSLYYQSYHLSVKLWRKGVTSYE